MKSSKRIPKPENETKLERAARYWLNNHGADYENGWRGAYRDLEYGGCQAGTVNFLIYYADTVRFFKHHKKEIIKLLNEALDSTGLDGPKALFGDKWDDMDPLADEDLNQNVLAWFGFEETARNIAFSNGYED